MAILFDSAGRSKYQSDWKWKSDFQSLLSATDRAEGSVLTSFVGFLITFALMVLMMLCYGFHSDWRALTIPLFVAHLVPLSGAVCG